MSEQLTQREINWIEGWIDALDADTYAAEILGKMVAAARGSHDAEQRAEQAERSRDANRRGLHDAWQQRDEARQEAAQAAIDLRESTRQYARRHDAAA